MKKFFRVLFPVKGDSGKEILRKIVFLVALVVFFVSGGLLLNDLIFLPAQNQGITDDIKQIYYQSSPSTSSQAEEQELSFQERMEALKTVNPDIKGWIQIPNTVIDYPVLQSPVSDPEYYLTHDYRKEYTKYGSIFADSNCTLDGTCQNIILYGHHMNDGQMFADILNYTDLDFYKTSPVFTFHTDSYEGQWKVVSVFRTNTLSSQGEPFAYNQIGFSSESAFLNFAYQLKIRSILDIPVDILPTDELVTLSTCSYELDEFRTVVVARRVREGEDATVDVSQASWNNRVVYPDGWYERYGGSKPSWPATYEDAVAQGVITDTLLTAG